MRAAPVANGSWTVYHHDNAHTGYDASVGAASGAATGWISPILNGSIYTEPLVYNGLVYVGTATDNVYALNQATGAVVWSRNLGKPATSGWQCGNVNPTGILGTGVIDTASSRIYYVPFDDNTHAYYLFALDLATGATVFSRIIQPTGFDWTIQQQRGALAISKDGTHVYVPFGGRWGDCGAYRGWVVGMPVTGAAADELYKTPSTGSGIWSAGGVLLDDSTGNVLFSTGNAIPCAGATGSSDAVVRTGPTLGAATSYFEPKDWATNWCAPDLDLGSASPVLISPNLMFMAGKYGQGFLLNPANLGGVDGQLFPAGGTGYTGADVCTGIHSDATFGSFAYAAPYVYVECEGSGLVALRVTTSSPQSFSLCDASCAAPSWNVGGSTTFGPPIVAGGNVWAADINGGGLYGFNAATGAQVFHSGSFGVTHFTTPSEAGGQIFVGAGTTVREFDMLTGCKSVSANGDKSSPQEVGTSITVTASASGCPDPNPMYRFALLKPGAASYQQVQAYSTTATFPWSTSNLAPGTYRFSVWAKDANSSGAFGNADGRWDAYNNSFTFTLTSCSSLSVAAAPSSPHEIGNGSATINITANAGGCTSPQYHFAILAPGASSYALAQDYSANSNVFAWKPNAVAPGTYRFSVWAKDAASSGAFGNTDGRWDVYNNSLTYTLTSCSSVSVSVSPPSPSSRGTTVTITATASGCTSPVYHFSILAPGASGYQVVQDYPANSNTYTWVTTTGQAAGTYRFSVWARDSGSSGATGNSTGRWDTYNNNLTYALS